MKTPNDFEMRLASILAVLIGLLLVPATLAISAVERTQKRAALDTALRGKAQDEAQALDGYFARARSIDLITAHNPGFLDFYTSGGRASRSAAHRHALTNAIDALNYLEQLYATSIGEACFIDHTGPENARVVRGTPATTKDLSPDESHNPFFRPTFAMRAGQVYQAAPYVSPDTHEWVISNSTLLPTADGSKPAIVHFEVTIESFRRQAASIAGRYGMRVVDGRTGQVVIDARYPQRLGAPLGEPSDRAFTSVARQRRGAGVVTLGRVRVAYHGLQRTPGNVNQWYVAASAPAVGASLVPFGVRSLAALVFALALVGSGLIMLRSARRELTRAALSDSLTHLSNRRRLMVDLERAIPRASDEAPLVFALFDLNGFKSYNDTFGHPAGDALLARLGQSLTRTMSRRGSCYRLGGDEFCVLVRRSSTEGESVVAAAAEALSEHGDGFSITASFGTVVIPTDPCANASDALRLADHRMYEQKRGGRLTAGQQSSAVLLKALEERQPELGVHLGGVAELAERVASELGANTDEVARIRRAAELHDIGKVAIPDAILGKPGPLDGDEWEFMKRHTLIGERILAAAPDLADIAVLVRASHERFDGGGYPDGLAGDEIPLGARIVSVCDAYDALVSDRPYRLGRDHDAAIAELRRCAGTQFDPEVVDAFCRVATGLAATI
jgi:diguanylate cyclase (GGDEF)-like protein